MAAIEHRAARSWARRYLGPIGLLAIAILLVGRLWWLPAPVALDVNEGWNAFHTAAAMGHGLLYPPPDALTGNNYPPLSFYAVGIVGKMTGDYIVAGRLVSLAAMLAVALAIFVAVRRICGESWPAMTGALVFLGFDVTRFRRYVAMDDPQWLAHALMTASIVLLLWPKDREPLRAGRVFAAAALMVAGGFVKHNPVAFPIAATLWLLLHDRRALLVWLASAVALIGLGTLLCREAYGPVFFVDLLTTDRQYSAARMISKSAAIIPFLLPMIVVGATLLGQRARDRRLDLILLMAAIALPFGIFQRSGIGVDFNAHFDTLIALSLATPLALVFCPPFPRTAPWVRCALLAIPLAILVPGAIAADLQELRGRDAAVRAIAPLEQRVATAPGPVACEDQSICYWAGKDFAVDYFIVSQRLATGHEVPALREAIAGRRFAIAELSADTWAAKDDPIATALASAYGPVFTAGGHVLLAPVRPKA